MILHPRFGGYLATPIAHDSITSANGKHEVPKATDPMSTALLIGAGIGYLLGILVGVWIAHGRRTAH
ncbi:hypothetical protein NBCG_04616 [Nocardioidaceae bacterium Broad-1]|nr:hypothetical protein NBCG_04616 [Nocardioidaceae bacterium Broad-1]